jgi:hypothetical protein
MIGGFNMNTHRIAFSMEDTDIEREATTLLITTTDDLHTVCEKMRESFNLYDRAEGIALDYREDYGWGIDGFVAYLTEQHDEWQIFEDTPDATLEFIGM